MKTLRILALGAIGAAALLGQAKMRQPDVPKNFTPPKTAWGEPDLQGIWPITHLEGIGLQRSGANKGKGFMMTDEEYDRATGVTPAAPAPAGGRGAGTGRGAAPAAGGRGGAGRGAAGGGGNAGGGNPIPVSETSQMVLRQTSMIFFPENGQFPELTPYGKELQAKMKGTYSPTQTVFDSSDDFAAWDRCITRGMPTSMEPRHYNNGIRIMQSPGYVIVLLEMAHEARVIPTKAMPKLDANVKEYMGEPRGHWEGNTLVVESTNYNGLVGMTSQGAVGSPTPLQPETPNMRTIEKFTRVSPVQIDYELTVEDPEVLAPGKMIIKYPMFLDNSYEMYEYACHEGNTAVRNYIETSRYEREHPSPAPAAAPQGQGGGRGGRGGGRGGPAQ